MASLASPPDPGRDGEMHISGRPRLTEIATCLWESVRETWPRTEEEAGPFIGGFTWAFVIHWVLLIVVTLAWYGQQP